jgi:hypothetical protein
MSRLIPLQAPKDLIFWRGSWKISKRESEQPSGLSRMRKTLWPAQSRKQGDLATQLKTELAELSILSRQIVSSEDKAMKQQSHKPTVSVLKP